MAARVSPPILPTPPMASSPAVSRWKNWTVTVLVVVLSIAALFALYHYETSLPPINSLDENFVSQQHRSDIHYNESKVCRNEAAPVYFRSFAEGFIRFDAAELRLNFFENFFVQCKRFGDPTPFFEGFASPIGELEFFLPNLPFRPFESKVQVVFGQGTKVQEAWLKVDQVRGLYTQKSNSFISEGVITPTILPVTSFPSTSLPREFAFQPDNTFQDSLTSNTDGLILSNLGTKRVIYLQVSSLNPAIAEDDRHMVLPFVVNAGKTLTISKALLNTLWSSAYLHSTNHRLDNADLQLHLGAIQQRVYV